MGKAYLLSVRGFVCRLLNMSRHGRIDNAGFDDRDADAEGFHLSSQCFAESLQGEFGCCVGGQRGRGDMSGDGATVDDASTFALAHLRRQRLDAAQDAEVVSLHDRAELGEREFFDGAVALHSGVVDQDVDLAGVLLDACNS